MRLRAAAWKFRVRKRRPATPGATPPAASAAGVHVDLAELIDMRHRVREVQLFSSPARRSPLIGLHHSKLRGRGVDFDQVRIYQPGDDVRTIDWRVTARTREPHTKLFHEERERPVFIMVEQSQRLFFGTGLVFSDQEHHEIKPRRSKQSLLQLLSRLARANQALGSPAAAQREGFSLALRRAREVLRPGSLVVILCDERTLSDTAEQQIALLARHTDLILMPVSDPLDHALPAAGLLRFAEQGAQLELDTHASDLRQAYREMGEARSARWERLAQKLGVLLLPLSTQEGMIEQLRDYLQRKGGAR